VTSHQRKINGIVSKLLEWYSKNARDLAWRRTTDPYGVYVSEIMLQQTQVATVIPFWERWMKALPDIKALANAKSERIHKLWEGLGYYTRVRNMQKAAQIIMAEHAGNFPRNFEHLLALPGIGRYTAGAICSIAFNQPTPILDGNVIRVLTRLFGIAANPREKETNTKLWNLAEELVIAASHSNRLFPNHASRVTHHASSHFNQSLMELGALVCTPKQPKCPVCPLSNRCAAHQRGSTSQLPNLARRPAPTRRRFAAFVTMDRGRFLVRQRPAGVVNAHLWEFPNTEIFAENEDLKKAAQKVLGHVPVSLEQLCTIKHSITRYRISLEVYSATTTFNTKRRPMNGEWFGGSELTALAFSSAHKKILKQLRFAGSAKSPAVQSPS
jgi:A/G-specific adenine glycosylase